jgi:hypothetical protein
VYIFIPPGGEDSTLVSYNVGFLRDGRTRADGRRIDRALRMAHRTCHNEGRSAVLAIPLDDVRRRRVVELPHGCQILRAQRLALMLARAAENVAQHIRW